MPVPLRVTVVGGGEDGVAQSVVMAFPAIHLHFVATAI
jgi:hypothetical protein